MRRPALSTFALADPRRPPRAPFPAVSRRPRLALYRNSRGGLDVAWNRAALICAPARAAFARQGVRPQIGVRLRRLDERGGQLLASADLEFAEARRCGAARYVPRTALAGGCYQAELGLSGAQGAWLTLVRSERVTVAVPVGARFLSCPPPPCPESNAAPTSADMPLLELREVPIHSITVPERPAVLEKDGGSGPLRPYPETAQALWAEIRVEGQAPPGTQLTLGGHSYRIGPGGRLVLRFVVNERTLIDGLLQQLPPAPLVARDEPVP